MAKVPKVADGVGSSCADMPAMLDGEATANETNMTFGPMLTLTHLKVREVIGTGHIDSTIKSTDGAS